MNSLLSSIIVFDVLTDVMGGDRKDERVTGALEKRDKSSEGNGRWDVNSRLR